MLPGESPQRFRVWTRAVAIVKNIAATHEFIKQLSQAKDFQDMVRIQTEFMQTLLKAFQEQTKNLGEAFTKAAASAGNTPFKTSI